jgi:glycerol-3-phosphate dehydrogenase
MTSIASSADGLRPSELIAGGRDPSRAPDSNRRRAAALARLGERHFDLLIIGGGATGAATARDAALRGLEVALVDAGDFAGETSSQSSKLIHGGLRYLQYGNLHLVFEGLVERRHLMHTAPHLCRPVEFLFPAYRGERPTLATLGTGIRLYNALALWRPPAGNRRLRADQLYELAPQLRTAGLEGAQAYVDCQTDDARLVLEHVLDAEAAGATVANHVRATALARDRKGRVRGATFVDVETSARIDTRATIVVSATGPFTDSFLAGNSAPRLRPTLGVHLVLDAARLPHNGRVLVLRSPRDNRLFFVMPAGPRTIVGTTDTDWPSAEPPRLGSEIRARGADVAYLLEALNHAMPPLRLTAADVVSTYAGLRPLLATSADTPSQTSREHDVAREADGLIVVAGGKLTTMRRMGEQIVEQVLDGLRAAGFERPVDRCVTAQRPLPGGAPPPPALTSPDLPVDVRAHLSTTYGGRAGELLALMAGSAHLAARVVPELPYLWAEVVFAARHEHARSLLDALARRVPVFRDARDQGLTVAADAAALLAAELGWTATRREHALERYRAAIDRSRRWRDEMPAALTSS